MQKRKLAIFDIDGTVFRKNLAFELINELAWLKIFEKTKRRMFLIFSLFVFFGFAQEVQATTYYIKNGGNNSNNCTSHATACATLAGVTAKSPEAGSDAYFICDGTWTTQQELGWSGTSSNAAVVGAYFGTGTVVDTSNRASAGNMPKIDGGLNATAWTVGAGALALGSYSGMLQATSKSYIKFENIDVTQSGGRGIVTSSCQHPTITRCKVTKCFGDGINTIDSDYATIEYTEVDLAPIQRLKTSALGASIATPSSPPGNSTGHTIRYNKVTRSHGEGIDLIKGTRNSVAEYNLVQNTRSVGIYISNGGQFNTVRHNLIYCPTVPTEAPWWPGTYSCNGIWIGNECTTGPTACGLSEDNVAYGNILFGNGNPASPYYGANLAIKGTTSAANCQISVKDQCYQTRNKFYNNTVVNGGGGNINVAADCIHNGTEIKNNISYCTTSNSTICSSYNTSAPTNSEITWADNLLYGGTIDPQSVGSGTVQSNPLLYSSNWVRSSIAKDSLTGIEFAITGSSPAINVGADLGDATDDILNLNMTNFNNGCGVLGTGSAAFTVEDQDEEGSWEIGADVSLAGGGGGTAPGTPSGLMVR